MEKEEVIIKFKILNKPAIIIKWEGIVMGNCFVNWEEIKDYSVVKTKSKAFMLLFVDDPQHFLDGANWLTKWWMRLNMLRSKTPIRISTAYLQCGLEELKEAILEGMKRHALAKRKTE
jgi:hypothetical protein